MPSGKQSRKNRLQPQKKQPAGNTAVVKKRGLPLRHTLPALMLIIIIGLAVYANTFDAPFEYDDGVNILENHFIRVNALTVDKLGGVLKSRSIRRPLANFTIALNYYFHQYDVTGYHIVNVTIHLVTAFLVFLITRQTLLLCRSDKAWIAIPAALLWLVNPVHTQSVTYIVQRMNSMAAMFYLLAMVCYIQARLIRCRTDDSVFGPIILFIAAALAGICGLASKENAATLPVMIFLYEWYFFQGLSKDWFKKQARWIIALAFILFLIVLIYMSGNRLAKIATKYAEENFTMSQRLLTEPGAVLYYLSLLFYPSPDRLRIIYDFPLVTSLFSVSALLPLLSLAGLMAAALMLRRRNRLVSFAIIWFLANLVIESSVFPLALAFEHRTYLPSVFPFIALVYVIFGRTTVPRALAFICALILVCGCWTWQRNAVWSNDITFWTDAAEKTPKNPWIHSFLGVLLVNAGRANEAEQHYRRSLELGPEDDRAFCNLGMILMYRGQNKRAQTLFKQALAIQPRSELALNGLGITSFQKGETVQSMTYFKQALTINPYYDEAAGNLKKAVRTIKQYGRTIDRLQQERSRYPDDPDITFKLAVVCQKATMDDLAVDLYQQALTLNPKCEKCMNALAGIFIADGRYDRAAHMLERMVPFHPDSPNLFYSLARVYARDNRKEKAVDALKKAVETGADDIDYIRADKNLEAIRDTDYFKRLTAGRGN